MSVSKNNEHAARWLKTAQDDLRAAHALADNGFHAHACFQAQQAAEKAVKAVWFLDSEDPWGHSVLKLIRQLENVRPGLLRCVESAADLDRFYIPTRYPDGLPGLTPDEAYFRKDADVALQAATEIVTVCEELLSC